MKKSVYGFLVLCAVVIATPLWAQANRNVAALEEIIVTANRREENLQDVAISIAAFTGELLKNSGTSNLKQLEQYTPSLKIFAVVDSRSTSLRIRGIGSTGANAGIDPSVGLFIDGVYQGRAGMSIADFMDPERVEVLRGPQGTLYGKNTAAGALNIISKAPSERFETELEAVLGNYNAREIRGMLNLPLGGGVNGLRLVGYRVERDGFDDNVFLNEDVNDADRWGAKARTFLDLNALGDLLISVDYAQESSNCCAPDVLDYQGVGSVLGLPFGLLASATGAALPMADPFDRKLSFNQPWLNEVSVGGVAAEWNLELDNALGLTWLNAWRQYQNDSRIDGDFSPFTAVSGASEVDLDQYSSEFRITSAEGGNWDYVAGLYYYYSKMDTSGETGLLDLLGPLFAFGLVFPEGSINFDSNTHQTTSYAAFGQANWNIDEQWRLTLGARITHEQKEREGWQRTVPKTVLDVPPIAGPDVYADEVRSETDLSPSISLTWFLRDHLMFYASVSQGFKSGGFNQLRTAVGVPGEFEDERSRNYELGWKGSWLNRRLRVNGAVFLVDYNDFQAQGFDGENFSVRNAGSLESEGIELDLMYLPNSHVTLGSAIGYNNVRYADFETGECRADQLFAVTGGSPFIVPDCVQDLTGKPLDNAPEWTVSTYAQLEYSLTGGLGWFGRIEHNYTDQFYMSQDLDKTLLNEDAQLVNARLGIFGKNRRWEVIAWGRNLFDEETYVIGFDIPVLSGYAGITAPPRTYGVTFHYRTE